MAGDLGSQQRNDAMNCSKERSSRKTDGVPSSDLTVRWSQFNGFFTVLSTLVDYFVDRTLFSMMLTTQTRSLAARPVVSTNAVPTPSAKALAGGVCQCRRDRRRKSAWETYHRQSILGATRGCVRAIVAAETSWNKQATQLRRCGGMCCGCRGSL